MVGKRLLISAGAILVLLSNPYLASQAFRAWEGTPVPMRSISKYDIAIVLTGVAATRSSAPDRVFFGKGADRVLHTIQLYKAGKINKVLISGGSGALVGKKVSEAEVLRNVFLYCGVPASAILIEPKSRNTIENARFSRKFVDRLKVKSKVLLITSAFHMPRSLGCFKRAGINADGYSTDFYSQQSQFDLGDLIPRESALSTWSLLFHEICGYWVYKLMGYS